MRTPTPELTRVHLDIEPYLDRPISHSLKWLYEIMKAPALVPYAFIPDVLSPEALESLEQLPIEENNRCSELDVLNHPVAGPLSRMMGRISLMNRYYEYDPSKIVTSLRNEQGNDLQMGLHRDLLDGHAVIYNYGVEGNLTYIIDGQDFPVHNNEIVVLNGAADWLDVTLYSASSWGEDSAHFGGVTVAHKVVGLGQTSRNRLLVYADGQTTKFTQIPVSETDDKPVDEHYLNPQLIQLRPELPRYGESRGA